MNKTVDLFAIQQKLYESLKPSGWASVLKSFLLGTEFTTILEQLYNLSTEGKKFTPALKDIFKAFEYCPFNDLHTVFITKEPFYKINVANGLAFDSSKAPNEHIYSTFVLDAVERTVYPYKTCKRDPDLSRWAKQGILLFNSNLTVQIDKANTHTMIWKPFTSFLLDTLSTLNAGLVFVFVGDDVKHLGKLVNSVTHYKYAIPHPSTGVDNKGLWDSQNIFPVISNIIHKNIKRTIVW